MAKNRAVTIDHANVGDRAEHRSVRICAGVAETEEPERMTGQQIDRLRADIRTLEAYLPAQLSEDELRAYAAARVRAGDGLGQVMAALKADFPGRYDGKLASAVVRGLLAA